METNYVARAKKLLQRQARTAALVIVPLAAAVSANAAAILPTGNFSCATSEGMPCSGGGASQLPDPGNGIEGVKHFTSGPVSFFSSGGTYYLTMTTSGPLLSGIENVTMPVTYDFTIGAIVYNANQNAATVGPLWTLTMRILALSGGAELGVFSTSGSGLGKFADNGSMLVNASGEQYITLETRIGLTTPNDFNMYTIDVPPNSVAFNAAVAPIPEPGTLGLVGAALAAAGLFVRRRRG